MLIFPAIEATEPIRWRRPSHGEKLSSNILGEAMRPPSLSRSRACLADRHRDHTPLTPYLMHHQNFGDALSFAAGCFSVAVSSGDSAID
jgi:hypothetical protein